MRNRLLSVRQSLAFIAIAACFSTVGSTLQADPTPQTGAVAQVLTPTQTWEERAREILRRMYLQVGGNPTNVDNLTLKSAALMVNTQFALNGLIDGLTAAELTQLENDALELAECAEWEPAPPVGTSFGLIVLLHDLGKSVYTAAVTY